MKYLDITVSFREHGIKRGTVRIDTGSPHIVSVSVPRKYVRLAARLLTGMLPGGTFVIKPLPWWKHLGNSYKLKVVGAGPRNEPGAVVHIERGVKG
jgi:hypothetical protein